MTQTGHGAYRSNEGESPATRVGCQNSVRVTARRRLRHQSQRVGKKMTDIAEKEDNRPDSDCWPLARAGPGYLRLKNAERSRVPWGRSRNLAQPTVAAREATARLGA